MPNRTDYLLLDLALYPGAEVLQRYLGTPDAATACRVVSIDAATASEDEWDAVLDAVLGSDRCITL